MTFPVDTFHVDTFQGIPGKRVSKIAQRKKLARMLGDRPSRASEHYGASAFTLPTVRSRVLKSGTVVGAYRTSPGPRQERNGPVTTVKTASHVFQVHSLETCLTCNPRRPYTTPDVES